MRFAIFGWQAMEMGRLAQAAGAAIVDGADNISSAVTEPIPLAIFTFLEELPRTPVKQGLATLIVAAFFATSSDPASLVVDMVSSGSTNAGPVRQRMFCGVAEGMIAATLILLAREAGLTTLQEVITVPGLPIFLLVCLMIPPLIPCTRDDTAACNRRKTRRARQNAVSPDCRSARP